MTFEEIKQGEETYIMHTYGRFPIALDHGKGATLWIRRERNTLI